MAAKATIERTRGRTFSQILPRICWGRFLTYIALSIGGVLMVLPFFWMVVSAFKQPNEIIAYPPIWIPKNPTFEAFPKIWTQFHFNAYMANSVLVTVVVMLGVTFTSALVGFVLGKYKFRGSNLMLLFLVATMMVPWPTLLIPQYWIVLKLKWINTFQALIVPNLFSAFGIFLVRQYMHGLPNELLDAARIDGASEPGLFFRIAIPMSIPALAAVAILHFLWSWDSFIWPLVVTNSTKMFTLPIGLQLFVGQYNTDYVAMNAGSTVAVIPILIVFLLLQRQFIEGIAMSGMKS